MLIKDRETLDRVRKECRSMVTKRAFASGGAAAIPTGAPGVVADVAMLMQMLPNISRKFGLDATQIDELDEQSRQQFFVIAGKLGNAMVGRLITESLVVTLLKRVGVRVATKTAASWVPFIGTGVAVAISFGMMKSVGNNHIEECYRVAEQFLDGAAPSA